MTTPTAPTTPAPAEKKRSVLTRQQSRFLEDTLEALIQSGANANLTRRGLLAVVNGRCEPRGFQITMANMVAAAETVQVTLPGSRDADAERDRETLQQLVAAMDRLLGGEIDGKLDEKAIKDVAHAWQTFRAGPLFAGKGETPG